MAGSDPVLRWNRLASQNPDKLQTLVEGAQLTVPELTFAAEALGRVGGPGVELLLRCSRNTSPVVREGAIYGLVKVLEDTVVRERLEAMRDSDQSRAIREIASEALLDT